MTEIENQQDDPTTDTTVIVAEGGDAGAQPEASANTDTPDFTGERGLTYADTADLEGTHTRLADGPDWDTRGQEEGAHESRVEIGVDVTDEDTPSFSAVSSDQLTKSALSQQTGISDEKLDEVLPCGHTRRDHHGDLTGGLPSFLKKLLGGEAPVKVTPIGEGFNLFEAITGLDQQRTAAVPTYGHNDQPEVSEAHQRLHDDIPLIEAQLEITLPSGEVFLTHIQADAGHAWGHTRHGDTQCLNATADLVGQLLNELRVRLDRELLLSNMYHDSRADNVCDK